MRIRSRIVAVFVLLILALLAACGSGPDLDEPPDVRYGEDVCERCLMIINEARYAAAYVTPDGEPRLFDDIGGMAAYINEAPKDGVPEEVAVFWVHDYDTEEWLKAEEAFYVESEDLATPMGFGIVAFADKNRAEEWAADQAGTIRSYSELFE
jgi:copper chaperone NosL